MGSRPWRCLHGVSQRAWRRSRRLTAWRRMREEEERRKREEGEEEEDEEDEGGPETVTERTLRRWCYDFRQGSRCILNQYGR